MDLEYTFEKRYDGEYQVRLNGEFVCYAPEKDSQYVDEVLREAGYESREHYLSERMKEYAKYFDI